MKNQCIIYFKLILFVFASLLTVQNISGQTHDIENDAAVKTIFSQVQSCAAPVITITTDLALFLQKGKEDQLAHISIAGSEESEWNIKLDIRGKYRRRICGFPPISLNFKKSELREKGYAPFDKIKLVTHCNDAKKGIESVYREYLAYELYNHITPNSFKAKLVEVKYVDSLKVIDDIVSWAIMLEPNKEMAARLGGEIIDKWNLQPDSLVDSNYARMALFQFMIGNHDWSLPMHRNIKCLYKEELGKYLIIPYDFDFSGLVAPEYLRLDNNLPMTHRLDRLYLGEYFDEHVLAASEHFLERKKDIIEYCKAFKRLPSKPRAEIRAFVNNFYRCINKHAKRVTKNYRLDYEVY